jgi:predicted GNAT superfamily acetyltransferase
MKPVATIRPARRAELPVAAALLATSLGFKPADAIPAWLMQTTNECGGLTLVAVRADEVIAVSYATCAARGAERFMFSCGLAVAPEHRGAGLGLALKRAQRRYARDLGYDRIRWTTDPLNGPALRVYLSGLGALITGYRSGLHDGLRADPGHPQDDLDVLLPLDRAPRVDETDLARVELPWTRADAGLADRARVRGAMTDLLASGYLGVDVELDLEARRCWVCFQRVAA